MKSAGNAVISTLLMHRSYGLQHLRHKRPTRRNRGLPDGAAITTLGAFRTFTNIPGPGVRTANFAAFGSWSEALLKDTESLRNSDALMRVAVPRRRGPAGLRCSVCNLVMLLFFHSARRAFRTCERGVVSLPSVRFACSRNAGRPLVKAVICRFLESGSHH